MSIKQTSSGFEMTCSLCGETIYLESPDFKTALEEARDQGWRWKLQGDDWEHYCECCEEED